MFDTLNEQQIKTISDYLNDIAKGVLLGAFIPSGTDLQATIISICFKITLSLLFLHLAVDINKNNNHVQH